MDQEPHPYESLNRPQPEPQRPRRVPRVAVAAGITALFALAGAGVALAAGSGGGTQGAALSSSSSSSTTTTPRGPAPFKQGHFHMHGGGPLGLGGDVIYGQYTVKDGNTYRTISMQVGQVTAVSSTSLTVLSADGHTQTYVVQPTTVVDSQAGGISTVASKDTVRVQSLVQGKSLTATQIVDVTKVGASRSGFGMEHPGMEHPGMPGGPPSAA